MRTNAKNFVKTLQTSQSPLRYKFLAKIRNFDSFGGCITTFFHDKREIWHGGAGPAVHSTAPNFTFIGATCRP